MCSNDKYLHLRLDRLAIAHAGVCPGADLKLIMPIAGATHVSGASAAYVCIQGPPVAVYQQLTRLDILQSYRDHDDGLEEFPDNWLMVIRGSSNLVQLDVYYPADYVGLICGYNRKLGIVEATVPQLADSTNSSCTFDS